MTRDDVRNLDRLRRTTGADKYVAGVAGGLARHFDIDPAIVRVLFVVLTFFGGTGLMLYGALWLLLPEDDGDQAIINLDSRSLMFALMAVLVFGAVLLVGDSWGGFGFPWPLTVIGLVVAVVLLSRDRKNQAIPPGAPPQDQQAPPYGAMVPPTGDDAGATAATSTPTSTLAAGAPADDYSTAHYPVLPPGYEQPSHPQLPPTQYQYQPPGGAWQPTPPVRPGNPRKRGPILFWFTMALAALGVGILGIVDVSGTSVPASAYPALVLTVIGAMLLIGAFFGRAGGLIFVGLIAAAATAGSAVADRDGGEVTTIAPATVSEAPATYDFDAGEIIFDLSAVSDPEELEGRDFQLHGDLGRIEVIVPDHVDVDVDAYVDGLGDVSLFGQHADGFGPRLTKFHDEPDELATFTLDVDLSVGEIVIQTQQEASR